MIFQIAGDYSIQLGGACQHLPGRKHCLRPGHHGHDEIDRSDPGENRLEVQHQPLPLLRLLVRLRHPVGLCLGQGRFTLRGHVNKQIYNKQRLNLNKQNYIKKYET